MAFRYCDLGRLVQDEPAKAHKRLQSAFAAVGCHLGAAARRLGVNRSSLLRWVARLEVLGYPDPRFGRRARPGPKKPRVKAA